MLLTIAFTFWLASSFIEYKIVKSNPRLQVLFKGVPGICISVAIGAALAFAVGASNAMPIVLAQIAGLASNDFTYKMYSKMAEWNERRHEVQDHLTTFKTTHPTVFSDAVDGVKAGFKTVVGIVLVLLWIVGLPLRTYRFIHSFFVKEQVHA